MSEKMVALTLLTTQSYGPSPFAPNISLDIV